MECPFLHSQAREIGLVIQDSGIPVRQWIYGEEDKPEVKPEVYPVQPKREWNVDWEAMVKGAVIGTLIITGGVLLLPLVGLFAAASNNVSKPTEVVVRERSPSPGITSELWCGDPALYCLLDDQDFRFDGLSTIVEVYRWFED